MPDKEDATLKPEGETPEERKPKPEDATNEPDTEKR